MKEIRNNTLSIKNVGQEVTLYGWVNNYRNLGGIIFIDLRDISGIMQLVINPDNKFYNIASNLRNEYVIKVSGTVLKRDNVNKNIATGEIELDVTNLELLNKSKELPFSINGEVTALEDTRLKYRYLDIRRSELSDKLVVRHKLYMAIRNYLDKLSFLEVETPILCKSTPEGARDFDKSIFIKVVTNDFSNLVTH